MFSKNIFHLFFSYLNPPYRRREVGDNIQNGKNAFLLLKGVFAQFCLFTYFSFFFSLPPLFPETLFSD